jgi:hypothetical protein
MNQVPLFPSNSPAACCKADTWLRDFEAVQKSGSRTSLLISPNAVSESLF